MIEQLKFGNVRSSDPDTSHAAAAIPREGMKANVLELFRNRAKDEDWARTRHRPDVIRLGFTDEELEILYRVNYVRPGMRPPGRGSVGKRRQELVELGLVEDSGERRPTETGCSAIVWRLVR